MKPCQSSWRSSAGATWARRRSVFGRAHARRAEELAREIVGPEVQGTAERVAPDVHVMNWPRCWQTALMTWIEPSSVRRREGLSRDVHREVIAAVGYLLGAADAHPRSRKRLRARTRRTPATCSRRRQHGLLQGRVVEPGNAGQQVLDHRRPRRSRSHPPSRHIHMALPGFLLESLGAAATGKESTRRDISAVSSWAGLPNSRATALSPELAWHRGRGGTRACVSQEKTAMAGGLRSRCCCAGRRNALPLASMTAKAMSELRADILRRSSACCRTRCCR